MRLRQTKKLAKEQKSEKGNHLSEWEKIWNYVRTKSYSYL